ncbi:MAG: hypothetical protein J5879_07030 [Clostridia bacterium]|nr:hypothetical protein [Clostridia bacterium]
MIWFRKCNPYPALLYFTAVTVLSAVYNNPYHTAVSLAAGIVMFVMMDGRARVAAWFFSVFVLTFIVNPIVSKKGATPVLFIGDDPVTLEAIVYGLNSAALITAVLFLFFCFTELLDSEKLLYLLSPLSSSAALTVSAVLRFAPLYAHQASLISDQQKAAGTEGGKSIPEKIRFGGRVFSALSTWALENGIKTADSMACRGYGTGRRSFYSFFGFRKSDGIFLMIQLILIASTVVFSLLSSCTFQYYPNVEMPEINAFSLISALSFTALTFSPIIAEITDRIKWKYLTSKI